MKCHLVLLASLSLLSISLCSPVKFENFCSDFLWIIADYLNDPAGSLGSLNGYCRNCFTEIHRPKHFFRKRFNIPELNDIKDCEHEFLYLLSLSPFSSDPLHVFYGVFEQVIKGKKNYDRLYVPLLSYLFRIFNTVPTSIQNNITSDGRSTINDYKIIYYESKGDYKSAFEAVPINKVYSWVSGKRHNKDIYKMFFANPQLVDILKNSFRNNPSPVMKYYWIFYCMLLDAPEDYYTDLLIQNPDLITECFENSNDLFKKISESEYSCFYYKVKEHLNRFYAHADDNDRNFYNLLIDVRLAPNFDGLIDTSTLTDYEKHLLAKAAVLGNKFEIFQQMFNSDVEVRSFLDSLTHYLNFETFGTLTVLFAGLGLYSQKQRDEFFSNPHKLILISRFYVSRHIYVYSDKLFVDLIAPPSLPSICPSLVTFTLPANTETYEFLFSKDCFGSLWSKMRVIDEETLSLFLYHFEQIPDLNRFRNFMTSFEVIKLIISSPILVKKVKEMGITLCFNHEHDKEKKIEIILEFLDSIKDAKDLASIFSLEEYQNKFITNLRTKDQLKKFEDLTNMSVADIFLSQEAHGPMTEYDYFKWRSVFNYWIKGDRRQDIARITSPAIIKLLRIEFYDEMLELVGRETLENAA